MLMNINTFVEICCKDNYDDVKELLQTDYNNYNNCKIALDFVIRTVNVSTNMVDKLRIIGLLVDEHPSIILNKNSYNLTPIEFLNLIIKNNYHDNYILVNNKLNELYNFYQNQYNIPKEA
jgi:hypothetical protein